MFYLVLNIFFTVTFLVVFRLFPRFKIDNLQAIVFNYFFCFIVSTFFVNNALIDQELQLDAPWLPFAVVLGILFISIFYIMALTAQRVSLTVASVASKMSLIVPTVVSLFILKSSQDFNLWNTFGLFLACAAVWLTSLPNKKKVNDLSGIAASGLELILLPLGVFLGSGLVDTLINVINRLYLTDATSPILPLTIFGIAACIGFGLLGVKIVRNTTQFHMRNVLAGLMLGLPNYFSIYFLIRALTFFENDGAFVYPISNIGVIILSTFLGIVLFTEKLSKANWIGAALAVASIALLSWK